MEWDDKEIRSQMQQHFSDFEFEVPGNDLWPEIETKIENRKRKKAIWWMLAGAVALFLIGFFSGIGYLQMNNPEKNTSMVNPDMILTDSGQEGLKPSPSDLKSEPAQSGTNRTLSGTTMYQEDQKGTSIGQTSPDVPLELESESNTNQDQPPHRVENTGHALTDAKITEGTHYNKLVSAPLLNNSPERKQSDNPVADPGVLNPDQLALRSDSTIASRQHSMFRNSENAWIAPQSEEPGSAGEPNNIVKLETQVGQPTASNSTTIPNSSDSGKKEDDNPVAFVKDQNEQDSATVENKMNAGATMDDLPARGKGWRLIASGGIGNFKPIEYSYGGGISNSGPSGGGSATNLFATFSSDNMDMSQPGTYFDYLKYSIPLDFNLMVQRDYSKRSSLETGLNFTRLHSVYYQNGERYEPVLTYMSLPVGYSYRFINRSRTSVETFAQVKLSKMLSAREKSKSYAESYGAVSTSRAVIETTGGINSSLKLGIGYSQQISYRLDLKTRLGVSRYFILDEQYHYSRAIQSFWPELQVGLSYSMR